MNSKSQSLVDELLRSGTIEIDGVTPASCILGTTTTSYDPEDMEEYGEITGREVTLDEFLRAATCGDVDDSTQSG